MLETLWPYLLSAFVGGSLVLLGEYLFICWLERPPPPPHEPRSPKMSYPAMPRDLLDDLIHVTSLSGTESTFNAALQFIFQQSTADTRWLRTKLATELDELLMKTPGKLFESLRLVSLDVGTEFPTMTDISMVGYQLEADGERLKSMDINFDMRYDGNFTLEVVAVMLLGKCADIYISVKSVRGKVRLMFRRYPYTHWACAFERPPDLQLHVHGSFQGRSIRQRIAALVSAQINKSVLQKHTLPNYKIRYKPFFPKNEPGALDLHALSKEPPTGFLTVYIFEISRLLIPSKETKVRVTAAIDSQCWVSKKGGVVIFDVTIRRKLFQSLGLICKQVGENKVEVDTVVPMTPAYEADLRRGDTVIAINNKYVTNVSQVGRMLRYMERKSFTLRIQRSGVHNERKRESVGAAAEGSAIGEAKKNSAETRKLSSISMKKVSEVMDGVKSHSKGLLQTGPPPAAQQTASRENSPSTSAKKDPEPTDPHSTGTPIESATSTGLRRRRCSVEKHSSDSSASSTPTPSEHTTPQKQKVKLATSETDADEPEADEENPEWKHNKCFKEPTTLSKAFTPIEIYQGGSTEYFNIKPIITMKNSFIFKLNENQKYVNINVWGRNNTNEKEVLLGYLNIPLSSILAECKNVTYGQHMRRYNFLPPDIDIPFSKTHELAAHKGFEPSLCYGDVLLWCCLTGEKQPLHKNLEHGASANKLTFQETTRPKAEALISKHDFIRTHFSGSTQCDFCNKKIWLKDAMRCNACGMSCHKKCMIKCQETSPCVKIVESNQGLLADSNQTFGNDKEITRLYPTFITSPAETQPDTEWDEEELNNIMTSDEALSPIQTIVAGLRRVSSTHSLSAPRNSSGQIKSLPPSPSHTPRKQSISTKNPFANIGELWRTNGVGATVEHLLTSEMSPDAMLVAAREHASDLLVSLSADQIHEMLLAVREEMQEASNDDQRGRALTALMLHCCAGAQLAQQSEPAPEQAPS